MEINDNSKIIWVVSVNSWTGEILDLEIRVIDKNTAIGNTGNGDGTASVSIYPKKSEYDECGFDKGKVIDIIKNRPWYEREILRYVYGVFKLSYPHEI